MQRFRGVPECIGVVIRRTGDVRAVAVTHNAPARGIVGGHPRGHASPDHAYGP
ncbi:hypothetical protein ABZ208_30640 [Streptomyces sp. NPDC006208]|uniref:hypothetical protein n=1 Tax=Streptomyces sp. NPDC006208 TaxID=3156734 RepID=UPI0033BF5CAD